MSQTTASLSHFSHIYDAAARTNLATTDFQVLAHGPDRLDDTGQQSRVFLSVIHCEKGPEFSETVCFVDKLLELQSMAGNTGKCCRNTRDQRWLFQQSHQHICHFTREPTLSHQLLKMEAEKRSTYSRIDGDAEIAQQTTGSVLHTDISAAEKSHQSLHNVISLH